MKRWIMVLLTLVCPLAFAQEADESDRTPVPEEHLEAYFADRPTGFLCDPQKLLPSDEKKERERFLRYHAEDSKIDFYLLLFGEDQSLPSDIRIEELGERFEANGKPALIALYFLGEPERASVEFSPSLQDKVSAADKNRILVQAVRAASSKSHAYDQLEAFCVQMAIRIFWVEKSVGLVADELSPQPTHPDHEAKGGLHEVPEWRIKLDALLDDYGLPVAIPVAAILAALMARWLIRRGAVYTFPVRPDESRLGGGHGAGIGTVVSFGGPSDSPTKQREQTRDPLGGI